MIADICPIVDLWFRVIGLEFRVTVRIITVRVRFRGYELMVSVYERN